jgi:outer membrane protein assembly factor BamA
VRRLTLLAGAALVLAAPRSLPAQEGAQLTTVIDSVAVVGARRVPVPQILAVAGIPVHQEISYRDVQRAISALYGTGQFDDVRVTQGRSCESRSSSARFSPAGASGAPSGSPSGACAAR